MGSLRRRGAVWWIRYNRHGRRHEESSHSDKKQVAIDLLRTREGDVAKGLPITAKIGQLRFDEAALDLITDYEINKKRSVDEVRRRIEKHLRPWFGGRRMATITTTDVRIYIAARQASTETVRKAYDLHLLNGQVRHVPERRRTASCPSNAEVNREVATLKRIFRLAQQAGKLLFVPHIPLLREDNVRTGFFEPEQLAGVLTHLPVPIRPVITFAYITGWRVVSEILPLEWRQVDFDTGEIRLDPGTTKNREGRIFPMTPELRELLEQRHRAAVVAQSEGHIVPWVFFRMVAKGRRGPQSPRPIRAFTKAWAHACRSAGCPGRIPHDLRRTAIRNLVRAGVPERVAMALSGHKTRSVFERYNIVSHGDLREAVARLSERLRGTKMGQSVLIAGADETPMMKTLKKIGGAARI